MKKLGLFLLGAALCLLTGCQTWQSGSYYWVEPLAGRYTQTEPVQMTPVIGYYDLRNAITDMADDGVTERLLDVDDYEGNLKDDVLQAVKYARETDPVGAYAFSRLSYQFDRIGNINVIKLKANFRHTREEVSAIEQVRYGQAMDQKIAEALDNFAPSLTLWISGYQETNFHQLIREYCDENPDKIMEYPAVLARVYPETGTSRVVDLQFNYDTPRDTMRTMQGVVNTIFSSAEGYVSYVEDEYTKASRLSSFLLELFDYVPERSDTPSYSLLCQGIGDSKAYANVFAAMCRKAGLWCQRVDGTRNGEEWSWNILRINDSYYYLDLLGDRELGQPNFRSDSQMAPYTWDKEDLPACDGGDVQGGGTEVTEPAVTEPEADGTEQTQPETTGPEA